MTLTACEVTAAEAPFDRVSKTIPHPLSWGAALWSVVSVRWATVALLLFLAGLVAQLNGAPHVVDALPGLLSGRRLGLGMGGRTSVAEQGT